MATVAHNKSITDLLPDTIIELYEVDVGSGIGVKRFHAGKIVDKNIIFNGLTYLCVPIEADGFESKGDGSLPRPRLVVANPDGLISDMIKRQDDMVGNKFKRIRIFLKFLDAANFPEKDNPFGTPDPESRFDDDIYVFNRKVSENKYYVEFELMSPLEVENYKLPARLMIANYCPWKYRGRGCRYGARGDDRGPATTLRDTENPGKVVYAADFFSPDLSIGGVPMADEKDKRFDDSNNGYGLSRMAWTGEYETVDFASITVKTNATLGNPTSVSVVDIPRDIRAGRTIPLLDSGGSSIGYMELTEIAKRTVRVEAGTITSNITVGGVLAPLTFINGGGGYNTNVGGTLTTSYGTGTATQVADSQIIDGVGTAWTKAMEGLPFNYTGGAAAGRDVGEIEKVNSATQLQVSVPGPSDRTIEAYIIGTSGGFTGTFTTDGDGVIESDSLAITAAGSGYEVSPPLIIGGSAYPSWPNSPNPKGEIRVTIYQSLDIQSYTYGATTFIGPLQQQLEAGEQIVFDSGATFTLAQAAPVGSESLIGYNDSMAPIVLEENGTVRTVIVGDVFLDDKSSTQLAANSTGTVGYSKGDVVMIPSGGGSQLDNTPFDEPPAFFVCIKAHTTKQDPRFKKEYWVEDQCGKTLGACEMRFEGYTHLPFGGFPSIEAYRYTN